MQHDPASSRRVGLRRFSATGVLLTCLLPGPQTAHGQAMQAAGTLRGEAPYGAKEAAARLQNLLATYACVEGQSTDPHDAQLARSVADAARRALTEVANPTAFRAAWQDVETAIAVYQTAHRAPIPLCPNASVQATAAPGPSPQVFNLVPTVVFGLGYQLTVGSGTAPVHSFGISTNLLGATAGGVLDAIGVAGLKDYLTDNMTVGAAFPAGGPRKLSGFAQVGLGQIVLPKVVLWPALTFEQFERGDERVPSELSALQSEVEDWTAIGFVLGLAAGTPGGLRDRIAGGKPVVVLILGVTLPHYFPGEPFESLAGLLTSRRDEYEKAGDVKFSVGLALPLAKAP